MYNQNMSEIYRDTVNQAVKLGITDASNVSATFVKNGNTYQATVVGDQAVIPYDVVYTDGVCTVNWTYTVGTSVYKRSEEISVVTPLFTKNELVADNAQFAVLTDAQVVNLERFVRLIIQNYTGQTFGQERGKVTAWGNGTSVLQSPKRIISLEGGWSSFKTTSSGFGIEAVIDRTVGGVAVPNITGPIYSPYPYTRSGSFKNNVSYELSGTFGWASVPEEVKQAALIIAGEFSCNEATWRDRYIKSIRAADWRFDFDGRSYVGTGSVTADQLLDPFVVNRMAVI